MTQTKKQYLEERAKVVKEKRKLIKELSTISRTLREKFEEGVVNFAMKNEATHTYEQVGKALGITKNEVSEICIRYGYSRLRGKGSPAVKARKENK